MTSLYPLYSAAQPSTAAAATYNNPNRSKSSSSSSSSIINMFPPGSVTVITIPHWRDEVDPFASNSSSSSSSSVSTAVTPFFTAQSTTAQQPTTASATVAYNNTAAAAPSHNEDDDLTFDVFDDEPSSSSSSSSSSAAASMNLELTSSEPSSTTSASASDFVAKKTGHQARFQNKNKQSKPKLADSETLRHQKMEDLADARKNGRYVAKIRKTKPDEPAIAHMVSCIMKGSEDASTNGALSTENIMDLVAGLAFGVGAETQPQQTQLQQHTPANLQAAQVAIHAVQEAPADDFISRILRAGLHSSASTTTTAAAVTTSQTVSANASHAMSDS